MKSDYAIQNPGLERLRAHLRRHNRWVLGLTIATFFASVALWAALYFVTWWLVLLGGTAVKSVDYHPAAEPLTRDFAVTAVLLCLVAWIIRRMRPNEAARDYKSLFEHILDVVLAIPRVTLAIFGTGGAAARLNETELRYAWDLLCRMDASEKPVHVQEVPADIPNPVMRDKILLALQLCGLIDIRPSPTGPVLAFQNDEARRIMSEQVRLRLRF